MDKDKEKLHSLRRAVAGRRADGLLVPQVQVDPRSHKVCHRVCLCVHAFVRSFICLFSEDSDFWSMGVKEWHAGYATASVKKYRHVINNRTKETFMEKMKIPERIRFTMWTSNDYLTGFKGVGPYTHSLSHTHTHTRTHSLTHTR